MWWPSSAAGRAGRRSGPDAPAPPLPAPRPSAQAPVRSALRRRDPSGRSGLALGGSDHWRKCGSGTPRATISSRTSCRVRSTSSAVDGPDVLSRQVDPQAHPGWPQLTLMARERSPVPGVITALPPDHRGWCVVGLRRGRPSRWVALGQRGHLSGATRFQFRCRRELLRSECASPTRPQGSVAFLRQGLLARRLPFRSPHGRVRPQRQWQVNARRTAPQPR